MLIRRQIGENVLMDDLDQRILGLLVDDARQPATVIQQPPRPGRGSVA